MGSRIDGYVQKIREFTGLEPEVGLILGSGLGDYADKLERPVKIAYRDLPDFPVSTVSGHAGQFVIGEYRGKKVIAMQGRVHFYEGYSQEEVALPVRIMKCLGVKHMVLTNAAGGINRAYEPGTLMLIRDHLNLSGSNPLRGKNEDSFGPRFPDLSETYSGWMRQKVKELAKEEGIRMEEGVYAMFAGPSYETPAEIKMAEILGADAAGMSTVPEAIVCAHCGISVLGISCITNMAAGILPQPLNHEEVMETAGRVRKEFERLLDLILEKVV